MMLSIPTIALVGNLVYLPALLAGPLGGVFAWSIQRMERREAAREGSRAKLDPGSDTLFPPHVRPVSDRQVVHA